MPNLTETEAYRAVLAQWTSQWNVLHPGFPCKFENEAFTEPSAGSWAALELHSLDSIQDTLGPPGARRYIRDAEVWVWLRVDINQGKGALNLLVDDVRKVFEGVSFGGIDPKGAMRTEKTRNDGRWFEVVAISPVMYYETR